MARKEANLSCVLLAQDFQPQHWNWTDEEKTHLGNITEMGEIIKNRLENGGCLIAEMYAIKHDKDEQKIWNEYKMIYEVKFTSNHVHFVIRFKKGDKLAVIASLIGVEPNFIEKPQRGRYAYDNMLSYLTHIKYAKKYQYDAHDVVTIAGKPYIEYYRERHESWTQGRAVITETELRKTFKFLEHKIFTGEITMQEIIFNKEYKIVYRKYRRKIDEAFDNVKHSNDLETKYLLDAQKKQNP